MAENETIEEEENPWDGDLEEDLSLFEADDVLEEQEAATSFDDVALSLLLFFMVTSLFASFQEAQENSSGKGVENLPVAGGVLDMGDSQQRHRVLVDVIDGNVVMEHAESGGGDGGRVEIALEDAKGAKLSRKLLQLVKEIEPTELKNPGRDGILVVARLPRNLTYDYAVGIWHVLARLYRTNRVFKARVSMVTWGSGTEADIAHE